MRPLTGWTRRGGCSRTRRCSATLTRRTRNDAPAGGCSDPRALGGAGSGLSGHHVRGPVLHDLRSGCGRGSGCRGDRLRLRWSGCSRSGAGSSGPAARTPPRPMRRPRSCRPQPARPRSPPASPAGSARCPSARVPRRAGHGSGSRGHD